MFLTESLAGGIQAALSHTHQDDHAVRPTLLSYIPAWNLYASAPPLEVAHALGLSLWTVPHATLTRQPSPMSGPARSVVLRALNGVTVLDLHRQVVAKLMLRSLEPQFRANTVRAARLVPEYVPPLIAHGKLGCFDYTLSALLPKSERHRYRQWPQMLQAITPAVSALYQRGGVQAHTPGKQAVEQLIRRMRQTQSRAPHMKRSFDHAIALVERAAERYSADRVSLPMLFCHGDLTLNNVLYGGQRLTLLDWANGGVHTAFYDLMIQNVYRPAAAAWTHFATIDFTRTHDTQIFHGWAPAFCALIAQVTATKVTNELVRLSLILALGEMAEKNFRRHQTHPEREEGERVLGILTTILRTVSA